MPINFDNKVLPRIKLNDQQIHRVYYGNGELVWGLFDIKYNLANGTNSPENPPNYVWGIPETLHDPTWSGITFGGWFTDILCHNKITSISIDSKEDLNLYAKWTRSKTQYKVTYSWEEGGGGGGGGEGWSIRTSAPGPSTWPYSETWGWSTRGQCTWYCYNRSGEATGYFMPYGNAPSSSGWKYTHAVDWPTGGGLIAGNIIVCSYTGSVTAYAPGHVMFIERVNGDTVILSDSYYGYGWSTSAGSVARGATLNASGGYFTVEGYSDNPNKASGGGGGGGGSTQTGTTGWQDDMSVPAGTTFVGIAATRIVYNDWDYTTNNWSSTWYEK